MCLVSKTIQLPPWGGEVDQHLHPSAPRDAAHQHLEECIVEMAANYRNPAIPAFDTSALVNCYNACIANQAEWFRVGTQECAREFLSCPGLRGNGLLNNLMMRPGFITTFVESAVCWGCYELQEQVNIPSI